MACGCTRHDNADNGDRSTRPTPTTQCLFCAQKHADEALAAMREYTYEVENRSFVHGALRSIVLHTYKNYKDVASIARNAALAWQDGRWGDAEKRLVEAIKLIYAKIDGDQK